VKYHVTVIIQDSLHQLVDGDRPRYAGLFADRVYGERPAVSFQDGQLFVWNRSGTPANAATIQSLIPPGSLRQAFYSLEENPRIKRDLLARTFRINFNTRLAFQEPPDPSQPNFILSRIEAGPGAEIRYGPPKNEHGNLFIAPLTFCLDTDIEAQKGTLQFLLEDEQLSRLCLILPPRPVDSSPLDRELFRSSSTNPHLESIRNQVADEFFEQLEMPPAGVVALKCAQNPYIQDAINEGGYLRFADTPYGRKIQLAVPGIHCASPSDRFRQVQQYRLGFFTDDHRYSGWQRQLHEDLLKPVFEHFVSSPASDRVCMVDGLEEAALASSISLLRFMNPAISRQLVNYRDYIRSGEHLDSLPGQFLPHVGRADEARARFNAYESQLEGVWQRGSPESYRFLKDRALELGPPEKDILAGLITQEPGMTNIGLIFSLFWPVLRPFLGLDPSRSVPVLGLPRTYGAFLDSMGLLADLGTTQAVDHFLDNSGMVEPGSSREERFFGPVDCVGPGYEIGYASGGPPLAIYYQQIPSCLRATILLHLLCPLNVRIVPGASAQVQPDYGQANGSPQPGLVRLIARTEEGLGYLAIG
jgi:hypothetical protein